ncbi:hypothetical protein V8E36_006324 [Tilletia maclaganii]
MSTDDATTHTHGAIIPPSAAPSSSDESAALSRSPVVTAAAAASAGGARAGATSATPASSSSTLSIGVPMSMPAILINPKTRPAGALPPRSSSTPTTSLNNKNHNKVVPEGKRRLLRSAHFRALTTGPCRATI